MDDETIIEAVEDDRRARLYDALWKIAYHQGGVKLDVVGGHSMEHVVWVGLGHTSFRGSLETVERQVTEYASRLGGDGTDD